MTITRLTPLVLKRVSSAISSFLVDFALRSGVSQVHIVAHSMGNRGLLRAMQRISADAALRSKVKFGQVFLAAADIDADLFKSLAFLYPLLSARTTMYASPGDLALKLSKWLHGYPRAGFTPPVTVVPDVDTVEVPKFDVASLGHSYYAEAAGVLHDMFDLLRHDTPPDERQCLFRHTTPAGQPYWSFML